MVRITISAHREVTIEAPDNWVSKIVEGMLREVDPLNVVDGMDFVDDHRDLLEIHYPFKQPTYPDIYEGLSATKIRNDPDKYKKYLDGRVYHKIKDLAK